MRLTLTEMVKQVRPAKYVAETIPYIVDFSDMLLPGESIVGTPTVSIYLVDGSDLNPSAMLFGGVTITGNVVTQNIRQGIAGDIYSIVFSISTNLSHTYEKDFYLAILPVSGSAVPNWQSIWLNSYIYPLYIYDALQAIPKVSSGSLLWNPSYYESISSNSTILVANLYGGSVTYQIPFESFQATPSITTGNLYGGSYDYDYAEALDANAAILSGNLFNSQISYYTPYEALQATPTILSGTLS